MPDHAGFVAAITLRERVLSDALLFAYSRPSFSRDLVIPFLGTGPAVVLQAFLSPPTVTCDATRDAIVVGVDLPGTLTIKASSGVETHPVLAHVDVAVPPVFTLEDGQLTLSPAHPDVKVVAWSYTVVGGAAFKPATDAYLLSSVMAERLSATVEFAFDANLLTLPSVDVRSLGAIVDAAAPPDTTAPVPVRVVDPSFWKAALIGPRHGADRWGSARIHPRDAGVSRVQLPHLGGGRHVGTADRSRAPRLDPRTR